MTIIQGYKLTKDNSYTLFAKNDTEAKEKMDRIGWTTCDVIPCRYVQANRWSFPVEVIKDNKIRTLYQLFQSRRTSITTVENENGKRQSPEYLLWENQIEGGKSYLVGSDVPTQKFLATHTSQMSDWQIIAHEYVCEHPDKMLIIITFAGRREYEWHIWLEGDHVVLGLPHQDAGGEKHWVSHVDRPTRKVLVNVD